MEYFLHIPKTAGSSFTCFLDEYYEKEKIFPFQNWNDFLKKRPSNMPNYELARGHFGYCFHHVFGIEKINFMTILRNPIERTISQYHHMTVDRMNNNWIYEFPYSKIEHMLYKCPWVISNIQVKHLAYDENILEKEIKFPYIFLENYENKNMEILFEKACFNLNKFIFIGIFEKIEKSIENLCEKMSWTKKQINHVNFLKNRPKVKNFKKRTIKKIEELNEWDLKLYEYAIQKINY